MILYCSGNNVRKMLHICNSGRMLFRHIFNLWLLIESMNTQSQIANYRIKSIFSSLQISASSVPRVSHWPPASLLHFYPWKMTTVVLYEGTLPGGHCFWEGLHGQTTTWTFKSQAKRDLQKESRSSSSLDTPAFLWHRVSTHHLCVVSPLLVWLKGTLTFSQISRTKAFFTHSSYLPWAIVLTRSSKQVCILLECYGVLCKRKE